MKVKEIPENIGYSKNIAELFHLKAIKTLIENLTQDDFKNRLIKLIEMREEFLLEQEI